MKHNYVVIKAYSVQILTQITFSQDEQTITHDSGNKVRKINRKDEFSGCLKRSLTWPRQQAEPFVSIFEVQAEGFQEAEDFWFHWIFGSSGGKMLCPSLSG